MQLYTLQTLFQWVPFTKELSLVLYSNDGCALYLNKVIVHFFEYVLGSACMGTGAISLYKRWKRLPNGVRFFCPHSRDLSYNRLTRFYASAIPNTRLSL